MLGVGVLFDIHVMVMMEIQSHPILSDFFQILLSSSLALTRNLKKFLSENCNINIVANYQRRRVEVKVNLELQRVINA